MFQDNIPARKFKTHVCTKSILARNIGAQHGYQEGKNSTVLGNMDA